MSDITWHEGTPENPQGQFLILTPHSQKVLFAELFYDKIDKTEYWYTNNGLYNTSVQWARIK